MKTKKSVLITTHPAVIAVWAAIIAAASLLPAFPIIGTGATFNIGNALVPLAGILFGPWAGAVAAGIGGFIGQLIAPHTVLFGPLQFTIAMFGAAAAGLAMQKKWIWPLAMILALGLVWYLFPTGRKAWPTPLLYLVGIAGVFVGWIWGRKWLTSSKKIEIFAGIFCCSIAGIVVTQAIGNLWALIMFALPPAIWFTVLAIAPIERISFAIAAAIVGTPLLIGLPKISVLVGPMLFEAESEEEYPEEELKEALKVPR
jgi:hypothetical protein